MVQSSYNVNNYNGIINNSYKGSTTSKIKTDIQEKAITSNKQTEVMDLYSDDKEISRILKKENIGVDEKNLSVARSLINNNMSVNKENMSKILDIRNKVDYITNNLTRDVANSLGSKGLMSFDLDSLYQNLKENGSNISNNMSSKRNDSITSDKLDKEVSYLFGRKGATEPQRQAVKSLMEYGIPTSKQNVTKLMNYESTLKSLANLDNDSIAVVTGKDLKHTGESLITTSKYMSSGYYTKPLSENDIEGLNGEINRVVSLQGFSVDQKTSIAGVSLVKNGFEINKSNMDGFMSLKGNVEKLNGVSMLDFGASLMKNGLDPNVDTIESIVQQIDTMNEEASTRPEDEANENIEKSAQTSKEEEQLLKDILSSKDGVKSEGVGSKDSDKTFDNLIRREIASYANNDTTKLYKEPSLNDLKKMQEQIERVLTDNDIEPSDENVRIARAMIKEGIEINKENFDKLKGIIKDQAEFAKSITMNEKITFGGKEVDLLSIKNLVDKLKASEEAVVKFFGKNSEQYKELMNLISKLDSIELNSFSSIAMVMKHQLAPNIRNLDMASMIVQGKITGSFDFQVDDNNIIPKALISSVSMDELTQKLSAIGLELTDENVDIAKALVNSRMEINIQNINEVRNSGKTLQNIIQFSRNQKFVALNEKLMSRGIKPEVYPLEKLERAIWIQRYTNRISQTSGYTQQDVDTLMDTVSNLKNMSNANLVKMVQSGSPRDVRDMSMFKQIKENEFSLAEGIKELEKQLRNNSSNDVKEQVLREINNLKDKIRELGIKGIIGERGKADIYSEGVNALKRVHETIAASSVPEKDALVASLNKVVRNVEVQENMNRESAFFQLPIYYQGKLTNLNVHFFNKANKNKKEIDPNNFSVALNLDTNNLGFIDIQLDVDKKNVDIKISANSEDDKLLIEKFQKLLGERVMEIGLEVGKLSVKANKMLSNEEANDDPEFNKEIGIRKNQDGRFEARI